jgi:hypothetical protein
MDTARAGKREAKGVLSEGYEDRGSWCLPSSEVQAVSEHLYCAQLRQHLISPPTNVRSHRSDATASSNFVYLYFFNLQIYNRWFLSILRLKEGGVDAEAGKGVLMQRAGQRR